MDPVGFVFGVIAFVEQAAHAINFLRSTLSNYGLNPAFLDTIQTFADSLFQQLDTLEFRFNLIAPSLLSPQLAGLEFHIRSLNDHLGEVGSALVSLHGTITYRAYAWRHANHIERELEYLHDALRDVKRDAQALQANLSMFETLDQSTPDVLDAVSHLFFLILVLVTVGLIAACVPGN